MKTLLLSLLLCGVACARTVTLVWDANPPADQVTVYRVYELVPAGWTQIGETTTPRFEVGERTPGKYEFAITAVNFWGESLRSESATTPAAPPSIPLPPSIEGAKRVVLEKSDDLERWTVAAYYDSIAQREFFRVNWPE